MNIKEMQAKLESLGYDVLQLGGWCPFQLSANHFDGYSVYMRCRGKSCSLDVYACHMSDKLPDDEFLVCEVETCYGEEPFSAGYIEIPEAWNMFNQLSEMAKETYSNLVFVNS